jgi:hypothetical protein
VAVKLRRRLTTREARAEEGDTNRENLEYEFLQPVEFAERLSRGGIASFIEWNGKYYATQLSELNKSLQTEEDSILLEDIPSAIRLKEKFPTQITIVLLFTADKAELLHNLDFAAYEESTNRHLVEWRDRLGKKYDDAERAMAQQPSNTSRQAYVKKKMVRAVVDLAFIVGKMREGHDIQVVANRRGALPQAVTEFLDIMKSVPKQRSHGRDLPPNESDLDPGALKVGQIWSSMTAAQLWKAGSAVFALLSGVAMLAYFMGKGRWP